MKFYAKGKIRDTAAMRAVLTRKSPNDYGDFAVLLADDDAIFLYTGANKSPDAYPAKAEQVPLDKLLGTIEREKFILFDDVAVRWVESLIARTGDAPHKPSDGLRQLWEPAKDTKAEEVVRPEPVVSSPNDKPLAEGGNPLIRFG